jgi:hypothetical protein
MATGRNARPIRKAHGRERLCLRGLANHKPPLFSISVDSKRFSYFVTRLESTVTGRFVSVDSKRLVSPKAGQTRSASQVLQTRELSKNGSLKSKKRQEGRWRYGIEAWCYSAGIVREEQLFVKRKDGEFVTCGVLWRCLRHAKDLMIGKAGKRLTYERREAGAKAFRSACSGEPRGSIAFLRLRIKLRLLNVGKRKRARHAVPLRVKRGTSGMWARGRRWGRA